MATFTPIGRADTHRLSLSAVSFSELAELHALHADASVHPFDAHAMHPHLAYTWDEIGHWRQDWAKSGIGFWTIRAQGERAVLGIGGLRFADGLITAYYRLHRSAWGFGYATEVISYALEQASLRLPDALVQAAVVPGNHASAAVAQRCGLVYCGRFPAARGGEEDLFQLSPRTPSARTPPQCHPVTP